MSPIGVSSMMWVDELACWSTGPTGRYPERPDVASVAPGSPASSPLTITRQGQRRTDICGPPVKTSPPVQPCGRARPACGRRPDTGRGSRQIDTARQPGHASGRLVLQGQPLLDHVGCLLGLYRVQAEAQLGPFPQVASESAQETLGLHLHAVLVGLRPRRRLTPASLDDRIGEQPCLARVPRPLMSFDDLDQPSSARLRPSSRSARAARSSLSMACPFNSIRFHTSSSTEPETSRTWLRFSRLSIPFIFRSLLCRSLVADQSSSP